MRTEQHMLPPEAFHHQGHIILLDGLMRPTGVSIDEYVLSTFPKMKTLADACYVAVVEADGSHKVWKSRSGRSL